MGSVKTPPTRRGGSRPVPAIPPPPPGAEAPRLPAGGRGPADASPRYPGWCDPRQLRLRQLRRGWRCGLSPSQQRAKRALDWLLCLLFALPALLIVAIAAVAIRLETPGPVFFCQDRLGHHGKVFRMWKLRTMVQGAAGRDAELAALNELPWPDFKISRDPRVTRVGRFLRHTSLDELPQIWNILRGEMSWVGPRPTNFLLADYQLWQTERLVLPPGITGLWQVLERAHCDFDRRLRLDLAYVRGWRLRLDLAILMATVGVVLLGRGAK